MNPHYGLWVVSLFAIVNISSTNQQYIQIELLHVISSDKKHLEKFQVKQPAKTFSLFQTAWKHSSWQATLFTAF